VLIAVLKHFPELELLGSGYNADRMDGQLEAFWTQTCQTLKSMSSWVPPSVARSPPNGARGGISGNSITIFSFLSLSCKL
jgi:hypothetical protein